MTLDEAVEIRKRSLLGEVVKRARLRQAVNVIGQHRAIEREYERKATLPDLSKHERARVNAVLLYNLAIACGKLNDWKEAA